MLDRFLAIPPGFFTADGERLGLRAYAFLTLLCLAFFLPGFATLPPTDRDESSFAQASKQMIESHDYVDIRFQDQDRYRKPVGIYWLQVASARLLSPHHLDEIWAYRVPSLIGAIVAVLMTACLGTLLFGPMTGLLAAIMMAGCMILNVEARLAKTDAALLASVMVGQYALARAYINCGRARTSWRLWLAFWSAIGFGILLKGPVILLVVVSTLVWLKMSEGNLGWFKSLRPLIGIPFTILLTAPWFITVMLASHGQFFEQAAVHDLFGKFWQGQDRGATPPGLHLLAMPLVFFPFALWVMLAAPDSWTNRRDPAVRFCLGWIIPAWVVFEVSLTKLPHYVLPLYPALAMLAAKALGEGFPLLALRRWRWLPPLAMGLWLISGMFLALGIVLASHRMNQSWNPGQIAASLLLLIAQGGSLFLLKQRKEGSVLTMAAGSLIFTMSVFAGTLPHMKHIWMSNEIVQMAQSLKPCPGPLRIMSAYTEPSLVFLTGTDTQLHPSGAFAPEMKAAPCDVGILEDDSLKPFLDSFQGAPVQPQLVATIYGFVVPRGKWRTIDFYLLPQKASTP